MASLFHPELESLEDRLTPATYGVPWPDPQHLTVSFVPDGTSLGPASTTGTVSSVTGANVILPGATSQLYSDMGDTGLSNWQDTILSALQTWATVTNINLTVVPEQGTSLNVVPDNGLPLGTPAPLEGDTSAGFGDIRIAAAPLSLDLVATTVPFDPGAGSWSGAIIFNTAYIHDFSPTAPASAAMDLYTVALHEAGHAFGLPDNTNPASVMYGAYVTAHTGLASSDIHAIQALYGPRTPDQWTSSFFGNSTACAPTNFDDAVLWQDLDNLVQAGNGAEAQVSLTTINADLSTPNAVEYFDYQSPGGGFTVDVHTVGLSLLQPDLTVLNSHGRVVGTGTLDPNTGDVTFHLASSTVGKTYEIEVGSTAGVFSVGAYQLQVTPDSANVLWMQNELQELLQLYDNPHDNLWNAAWLQPLTPGGGLFSTVVNLDNAPGLSFTQIQAPCAASNGSLNVYLWSTTLGTTLPTVTLLDAWGDVVPTTEQILPDGSVRLTLTGTTTPGSVYTVEVRGTPGTATYHLAAAFGYQQPVAAVVQSGSITTTVPTTDPTTVAGSQAANDFTVTQTGVVQLRVSATFSGSFTTSYGSPLELLVLDSAGNIRYDNTFSPGTPLTATLLLAPGTYEVLLTCAVSAGGNDPGLSNGGTLNYTLAIQSLNGPIGPPLSNPDNPAPPPTWAPTPPTNPFLSISDPYGRPFQYYFLPNGAFVQILEGAPIPSQYEDLTKVSVPPQ